MLGRTAGIRIDPTQPQNDCVGVKYYLDWVVELVSDSDSNKRDVLLHDSSGGDVERMS